MRRLSLLTAVMISSSFVFLFPARASASVAVGVSVNLFHDSLAPYGDWIQNERFGLVWTPRHVGHDWRPYTLGHWVYTDYDWTWVSDDDWGWATDHYGRWTFDPACGWIWIPGNDWAPAWVVWRSGGGYVGWAPMPPAVDAFHIDFGFRIDPLAFSFVDTRHFCEPHVYRHFAPVARNVTFINVTQNVTNYTVINNRIVNHGVDVERVERVTGHAVPRVQVREVASIDAARGHVDHGAVAVFRPKAPPRVDSRKDVHAFTNPRPQDIERRQEKERKSFDSAEQKERTELRKIHEREERQPPVVSDDRGFTKPHHDDVRAERRPEAATGRADAAPAPRPQTRGTGPDVGAPHRLGPSEVRQLHQQEVKAQAEHESRERQALSQRQERERQALRSGKPSPAHAVARTQKSDKDEKKSGHH